jgi:hypothetical protein
MPKVTISLSDAELAYVKAQAESAGALSPAAFLEGVCGRELARRMNHEPDWRAQALGLEAQLARSERRVDILKEMLVESVVGGKYAHLPQELPFSDEEIPF